jgi:drug/metabolite transporter (DMT)-like permease
MGITYGLGLFCWYKLLSNMGTSKSSVMTSGDTIMTIIFAIILLGELLTIYHIIGTVLIIISVIMIVKPEKEEQIVSIITLA